MANGALARAYPRTSAAMPSCASLLATGVRYQQPAWQGAATWTVGPRAERTERQDLGMPTTAASTGGPSADRSSRDRRNAATRVPQGGPRDLARGLREPDGAPREALTRCLPDRLGTGPWAAARRPRSRLTLAGVSRETDGACPRHTATNLESTRHHDLTFTAPDHRRPQRMSAAFYRGTRLTHECATSRRVRLRCGG
jgi:hypothetical protein